MSSILHNKQKQEILSTLNEHTSPFKPSKTQALFKNVANLSIRGNTYDARHLDQFLDSHYGERSTMYNQPSTNLKGQKIFNKG